MRALVEATLVSAFSIALTLLIMAMIFPRHAVGGGGPELESPAIRPAVFVDGTHDRPGVAGESTNSRLAERALSGQCPYLAAIIAASDCPATPEVESATSCPYLLEKHRQDVEAETQPAAPLAQDI